jgi:Na+-driven multidrug efflux pump
MRETRQTNVPMISGITAVFVNLVLNYVLIYGHFGAPALGVVGAGIATNASRICECAINMIWAHRNSDKAVYLKDAYRSLAVPRALAGRILIVSAPMFVNEFLWSSGQAMLNQLMSQRGAEVIPAINISSTVGNLSSTFYFAMGISISIIVGNVLGTGDMKKAVDTDRKLMTASFMMTIVIALLTFTLGGIYPAVYNTTPGIRALASTFIRITAVYMPMEAILNASYFTIRSGGKTFITFLFDSCFVWVCNIPAAFIMVKFTQMAIIPIYAVVFGLNIIKTIIGLVLVISGMWLNDLVSREGGGSSSEAS